MFADFFFALFPWLFLWSLQMGRREKLVIAGSMSLGLLYVPFPELAYLSYDLTRINHSAGACGIKRTIEVPSLSSQNYLSMTCRPKFHVTFHSI